MRARSKGPGEEGEEGEARAPEFLLSKSGSLQAKKTMFSHHAGFIYTRADALFSTNGTSGLTSEGVMGAADMQKASSRRPGHFKFPQEITKLINADYWHCSLVALYLLCTVSQHWTAVLTQSFLP